MLLSDNSISQAVAHPLSSCVFPFFFPIPSHTLANASNSQHTKFRYLAYIDNNTITYFISYMKVYCDFNKCALQIIEFRHGLLFTLPISPPTNISYLILAGLKTGQALLCNTHNPVPFIYLRFDILLSERSMNKFVYPHTCLIESG